MKSRYEVKGILLGMVGLLALAFAGIRAIAQLPPPPPGERRFATAFGPGMDFQFFAKVVKGAPFSAQAVTEENQTLNDGNQIHRTATSPLYRDSEGRTRWELPRGFLRPWSGPEGSAQNIVLIHDPVAGVNYNLDPNSKVARKMLPPPMPPDLQPATAAPGSTNTAPPPPGAGAFAANVNGPLEGRIAEEGGTVSKESLGTQVIEGVQAEGTRRTVTIPAEAIGNVKPIQIVIERWYSPALQLVVMSKRSDPRVGETTYRLTNINQAEPSADLFQVPADYTVQDAPGRLRLQNRREH